MRSLQKTTANQCRMLRNVWVDVVALKHGTSPPNLGSVFRRENKKEEQEEFSAGTKSRSERPLWLIREALLDVMSGQDIRCLLASYVPSVTLVHHAEEVWINKKTGETYRKDKTDHHRKTSENISMTARSRFPDILDMIKILQGGTADSRASPPPLICTLGWKFRGFIVWTHFKWNLKRSVASLFLQVRLPAGTWAFCLATLPFLLLTTKNPDIYRIPLSKVTYSEENRIFYLQNKKRVVESPL